MSSSTDVAIRQARDFKRSLAMLGALVLLAVAMFVSNREPADANQHSDLTADQLLGTWPDAGEFPLALPAVLPPGMKRDDGAGFSLSSLVVDRDVPPARRVWVQYYESDVLGGAFRVFQRPDAVPRDGPCGPMGEVPHLERAVPGGTFTVCSTELRNDEAAEYWSTVVLMSDLDRVDWLSK